MPILTPDVEQDLIARIIVLAPSLGFIASGDKCNISPGPVQEHGGEVKLHHTFVHFYNERRRTHYDGQGRELLVQITSRFARDGYTPQRRAEAAARQRLLYDAIHLSGGWTTGPRSYLDIRAVDAPNELQPAYFAMNVAVWWAQ
jgi:hypothetical protein